MDMEELETNTVDPIKMCQALEKCVEGSDIWLEYYLMAYKELSRFFHSLGSVFSFVAKDVDDKIAILETYRTDPKLQEHYASLQVMVRYEESENLLRDAKRPSGARTALRLHRALKFFAMFMEAVSQIENEVKTGPVARECYTKSLAPFHTWWVQKTASVAMYTLPTRNQLVKKVFVQETDSSGDDESEWKQHSELMRRMANVATQVFDLVDKFYSDNNIHDLP